MKKNLIFLLATLALSAEIWGATYSPIVLEIDGEKFSNEKAALVCESATKETDEVKQALKKIIFLAEQNDEAGLGASLTKALEAKKAIKFLKMFAIRDAEKIDLKTISKIGSSIVATFKPSKKTFRRGMNFFVFKQRDGKLLWDVSINSPLCAMLADSAAYATVSHLPQTDKYAEKVSDKKSPLIIFNGVAFENILEDPKVNELASAKFYHDAQTLFFAYKLEDYAKFMTPKSAEKFSNMYLSMGEKERRNALSEYFSWTKKYIKMLDAGDLQILYFKRLKSGQPEQFDCVYIVKNQNGKMQIANFDAKKSFFDLLISRFFFDESKDPMQKVLRGF